MADADPSQDAARTDAPRGSWGDWATDRALRGAIAACLALPLPLRLRLMGRLVSGVVAPLAGYRPRAIENLLHVWPDMPRDRARALADRVADNAGRTMIENYDVLGLRDRMADVPLTGHGVDDMEAARAAGRPILFVTGHYGNFEAPRAALVARGWQIGGLYRPMSNVYFNAHYAANMHRLSGPVFEQGRRGTLGLLKHLKGGGNGVLLFDLYSGRGVPIDFLGRPAPTLTSAAEIAVRTGALMVPFFGIRQPDGQSFEPRFDAPIPHGDPVEMMRAATAALEARIHDDPAQWFWIHRRWKPDRQAKRQRKRAAANTSP
ncbi:Lipid A biosynthesis lauroyl acyltransferase [Roseivivax jejudonensis]|uniref:Lipid A biosynthesis lauroyl acyltransferase n=1 Tax=Roseivivax jejudonensis TaxID=1529041 RepID=A0A1X6YTJ5_9RHOB|nr:lysophospholipid acyltransferase family protein [Roseivivax jejudonensis]SLN30399.1 Lipid A biosynthesis lauroyl acyltransferase [Roseivivax jejudonensis]